MSTVHSMFFKMLSVRTRMQILKLLNKHDDLTVDDLATHLGLALPGAPAYAERCDVQTGCANPLPRGK